MDETLPRPSRNEFVVLMALMAGLDAIALDSMLPALSQIAADLGVTDDNDRQFVVTSIFFGFAFGLLIYGFLGDSFGRKRPVCIGFIVFIIGTLVCQFSNSLAMMLAGRVLQGAGAAGPYVLSVAMVRDLFEGRRMAEIMSWIMMVFILLPAIAPLVGQGILMLAHWRDIFLFLLFFALLVLVWFVIRQPETLPAEKRVVLSADQMWRSSREVLKNRAVVGYTIALGLIFGGLVAFLSSSQQVFQEHFGLGKMFSLYIGSLALSLGLASYLNSRWVAKLGMFVIVWRGLWAMCITAWVFLAIGYRVDGGLTLWNYMICMMIIYFCMGVLFGNLMSLALEPMGHVAGVASAVVGFTEIMIAMILGGLIAGLYDGTVMPIVAGFALASPAALLLVRWGRRNSEVHDARKVTEKIT
jgi:DHA1 family bicyclomycin/chloramphenicol resistance-like MFS transporter